MDQLALFGLFFFAIALGWWMGRHYHPGAGTAAADSTATDNYYQGINYLLNEQPDAALDAFTAKVEVNGDTLETHLAVGNLMRRKGEVERAIRVHQNLLARSNLSEQQLQQAHLELARDFISAGLHDRAERLLLDLQNAHRPLREEASRHLLEIYQGERDWPRAVEVARAMLPRKRLLKAYEGVDPALLRSLAHYHCELAEQAVQKHDFCSARESLRQSLSYERGCVRASLIMGRVELLSGHPAMAIKALAGIRWQNAIFLPEAIPLLRESHRQLDQMAQYRALLRDWHTRYGSTRIALALSEEIMAEQGARQVVAFLTTALREHATLRGVSALFSAYSAIDTERSDRAAVQIIQSMAAELLRQKPQYRCRHCGFSGRQLHWLCPSCHRWGEVEPIRGAEGD